MDPEIRRYLNIRLDEMERRFNDRLELLAHLIRELRKLCPDCGSKLDPDGVCRVAYCERAGWCAYCGTGLNEPPKDGCPHDPHREAHR
jgi:hypothetical protein